MCKNFTPSYLKSFNDVILHHSFLQLCAKLYMADPRLKPEVDPFLSPIHTSNEVFKNLNIIYLLKRNIFKLKILSLFPPVYLIAGGGDPLHDDCIRFLQKMLKIGKNIKMKSYVGLTHGFLNYDYLGGLKPAGFAIEDTISEFIKFVDSVIKNNN